MVGVGRNALCIRVAEGDLFVAGICRACREDEGNACAESQSKTQNELISQCRDQILKRGLVFGLDILAVSLMCTDFSKYAFFLSFLREAGHSA